MYSRTELPQIPEAQLAEFLKFCRERGVSSEPVLIPVASLKPIQDELKRDKVVQMSKTPITVPILVAEDNSIVDGHHRWLARALQDTRGLAVCVKIYASVDKIIDLGNEFEGSFNASIHEMLAMYRDMLH